jgi:hypothetical protein
MDAIAVVRVEAHRKESALLSDRDSLGLSGALALVGAAGFVAMGTAPLLFGRDDLPVDPFMLAAGGAYAGLGVGSLAMAAFHTATDGPDAEKLSTLAQLLQPASSPHRFRAGGELVDAHRIDGEQGRFDAGTEGGADQHHQHQEAQTQQVIHAVDGPLAITPFNLPRQWGRRRRRG